MDSEGDLLEGLANMIGIGERLEEIAADLIEDIEVALMSRIDHLDSVKSPPCRNVKSPEVAKGGCALGANGNSAREQIWGSANFCAALHAGVAPDGHQSAFVASDEPASQRQVDDRFDVGSAMAMLSDTHRPDEDGGFGLAQHSGKVEHSVAGGTRMRFQQLP